MLGQVLSVTRLSSNAPLTINGGLPLSVTRLSSHYGATTSTSLALALPPPARESRAWAAAASTSGASATTLGGLRGLLRLVRRESSGQEALFRRRAADLASREAAVESVARLRSNVVRLRLTVTRQRSAIA